MSEYTLEYWRSFLSLCDHWRTLTPAQRAACLGIAPTVQAAGTIPADLPDAAEAAFLERDDEGRPRFRREFVRFQKLILRARHWSLEDGLHLPRYLQEMTTAAQRIALSGGTTRDAAAAMVEVDNRILQGRFGQDLLASPTAESFMAGIDGWQAVGIDYDEAAHRDLKAWFRTNSAGERRVKPVHTETFRLPGSATAPEILLGLVLEYGLGLLAVHPQTLMTLINLPVPRRKTSHGPGNIVLKPFAGTQAFSRPFLLDDMATYLRAVKTHPAPLLSDGVNAPIGHHRKVGRTLLPLPFHLDLPGWEPERRAEAAWWMLMDLGLLVDVERTRKGTQVGPAPAAETWLAQPLEKRLRDVLEKYPAGPRVRREPHRSFSLLGGFSAHPFPYAAFDLDLMLSLDQAVELLEQPADMGIWMNSAQEKANPFLAALEKDFELDFRWQRWEATPEDVYGRLLSYLVARLASVGALELRTDAEGRLGLVLTDAGRWLFGKAKDWALPAAEKAIAVVGGDFTITLLEASLELEAELAAFAVPVAGNGSAGSSYRLTRASVQTAAHGGLAAERMIAVLNAWSRHALPANVVHEIAAWAGSRKAFKLREAVLVECDDPLAVAELLSAAPKDFERVSPTALAYRGKAKAAALIQRLSKKGFLFG